jgi:hypothetical protein
MYIFYQHLVENVSNLNIKTIRFFYKIVIFKKIDIIKPFFEQKATHF